MTRYLTTEAEFISLLAKNGEWASEQNINKSILVLKNEQLDMNRRMNLIFGERPAEWSETTEYYLGDLIQFSGIYYVCVKDNTGRQPDFNPEEWEIVPIDIDADQIAYNRYIIQDKDPQTEDDTIWTLKQLQNQILYTERPANVFAAINGLDRLKANINGNPQELFLVKDSDNALSAVTRQWALVQLDTRAAVNGSNLINFNVAVPTASTHATPKSYVDDLGKDFDNKLLNYAAINGNSSKVFNVSTPVLATHAATKGYVDTELQNVIANGSNNIIKKIDKVIVAGQEASTSVGVTMESGKVMIYSGSVLMYEGVDYTLSGSVIIWTTNRFIGERITILFLEEGALTAILDPIYVKQTGDEMSGILKCSVLPTTDSDLTNKQYVDSTQTKSNTYTDNKIAEVNNFLVPPGGIISFSGTAIELANLAPYWYLCDGSNQTPDLRGRFILGEGFIGADNFVFGQAGGSVNKNISVDNLPPHNHELLMGQEGPSAHNAPDGYDELTLKPVTPGVSGNKTVVNTTGAGQPINIMPPYYVLSYIMRSKS
jgi:microcystin-dependent protein